MQVRGQIAGANVGPVDKSAAAAAVGSYRVLEAAPCSHFAPAVVGAVDTAALARWCRRWTAAFEAAARTAVVALLG